MVVVVVVVELWGEEEFGKEDRLRVRRVKNAPPCIFPFALCA